jgi:hypothetical protein
LITDPTIAVLHLRISIENKKATVAFFILNVDLHAFPIHIYIGIIQQGAQIHPYHTSQIIPEEILLFAVPDHL